MHAPKRFISRSAGLPTPRRVTAQNSEGLRQALFDTMDRLRNGETSPTVANATSRLAEQIISTVQLEMEVEMQAHELHKRSDIIGDSLPPVVPLGNRAEVTQQVIEDTEANEDE
jgi:hypothetical protein